MDPLNAEKQCLERPAAPRRLSVLGALLFVVVTLVAGFACGSNGSSGSEGASRTSGASADATAPATGMLTNADGWPRVEGLRGERYCEVLLARIIEARLSAEVWNTYGLNDCPPDAWAALDAEAIKAERSVNAALLNGPRYWLMDAIEKKPTGQRQETTFGTLDMFLAATVYLGPIPPNLNAYTERKVARGAIFEFAEGAEVYELLDPSGKVYVMQSYSQQRAPDLSEADLHALASRITPPAGWTYRARTLETALRVEGRTAGSTVLQDDLANTYSLLESN